MNISTLAQSVFGPFCLVCVCVYIYMHACMHACMHTYIHTYILLIYLFIYTSLPHPQDEPTWSNARLGESHVSRCIADPSPECWAGTSDPQWSLGVAPDAPGGRRTSYAFDQATSASAIPLGPVSEIFSMANGGNVIEMFWFVVKFVNLYFLKSQYFRLPVGQLKLLDRKLNVRLLENPKVRPGYKNWMKSMKMLSQSKLQAAYWQSALQSSRENISICLQTPCQTWK